MDICAIRSKAQAEPPDGLKYLGGPERLDELLGEVDHLAVTLSLSPETRHLLDDRRLRLMKPTAFLVNVARGEIIEETALFDALASLRLAGAAIDVWYRYQILQTQSFHDIDNVLMTPHASGWTEGMLNARVKMIAVNIERVAKQELPVNPISRS